ncbi:MAG: universal stress protein, partial [Candidatus Hermodarchaeota archaeon]|nr:universal stress protein [Candidatus Hermodarchaeota archaeon]
VLKKILIPLQGFPAEVHAVNLAFSLAEPNKTNLLFLHCRERGTRSKIRIIDQLLKHIESLSKKLGVPHTYHSEARIRASDSILNAEREEDVDLIILGAARNPKHKHLLGSTARRVTRKSNAPNLVMSSWLDDLKAIPKPSWKKLLLPLRKVKKDIAALNLAAALKRSSAAKAAELIALNLTPFQLVTEEKAAETPEAKLAKELFMDDLAIFTEDTGLQVTPKHMATRNVGEGALEIAEQEKVDLIILGATRKPGRFGDILGRVSYQIALEAKASVVIPFISTGSKVDENNMSENKHK